MFKKLEDILKCSFCVSGNFEYTSDDEFEDGLRIEIPSKEITSILAYDNKDEYYMCYTLESGGSCDWELSYRQLINYISKYPNHSARK